MSGLDRTVAPYDAARRALAEARTVDDVKDILDRAAALKEYARRAKNTALIDDATALKLNAERRLGEMLAEQKETVGFNRGVRMAGRDILGGSIVEPPTDVPTLAEAGIDKKLSARAQKLAAMPPDAFETRLAAAKREAVKSVESPRAERVAEKKAHRAQRERELADKITALPEQTFGVIYADPPWKFVVWGGDTTGTGMLIGVADNHYPCRPLDDIKAAIKEIAPARVADDAALFLWATIPMLPQALEVMAAWGFTYKSHCAWVKDRPGTGYWFRETHELLLVGTRGEIPAPATAVFESVVHAPRGEPSAKPAIFREMIEAMFPNLPKLEMFARGKAPPGWVFWGNEVEGEP